MLISSELILKACTQRKDKQPFVLTLGLVFLAFTRFVMSLWPNFIPPTVYIWQAAAPESSMKFTLIGALILIPIILVYTFLSYWVLHEKCVLVMKVIIKQGYPDEKIQTRLSPTVWSILLWCFGFLSLGLIAGFFTCE